MLAAYAFLIFQKNRKIFRGLLQGTGPKELLVAVYLAFGFALVTGAVHIAPYAPPPFQSGLEATLFGLSWSLLIFLATISYGIFRKSRYPELYLLGLLISNGALALAYYPLRHIDYGSQFLHGLIGVGLLAILSMDQLAVGEYVHPFLRSFSHIVLIGFTLWFLMIGAGAYFRIELNPAKSLLYSGFLMLGATWLYFEGLVASGRSRRYQDSKVFSGNLDSDSLEKPRFFSIQAPGLLPAGTEAVPVSIPLHESVSPPTGSITPLREDQAFALAIDSAGNVYITGASLGSGTNYDFATIKYDTNGNQVWVARYNGPVNDQDWASALAIDPTGNILITGYSWSGGIDEWDYATVKYDPSGNQVWVSRYNGPGAGEDRPVAIAADLSGNVYVTGFSIGIGSSEDYATIKYDPNGTQLWAARYNGSRNFHDLATDLTVDGLGNVYVTGYSYAPGTPWDYATIKYDTNGSQKWAAYYDGGASDFATALVVDVFGNVYVTGYSWPGVGCCILNAWDYLTVKYDTNGNQIWVARYSGGLTDPGVQGDLARAIAIDTRGNIFVTGVSNRASSTSDYATIKYEQMP
jgi:hypothetical protein